MKRNNKVRTFLCVILAVTVLTTFAAIAAGGAGSQADPLVTLSYLSETFTGQIMEKVNDLLAQRNAALNQEISGKLAQLPGGAGGNGESYTVVTLAVGQTLQGEVGCEVLLRSGSAVCTGDGTVGLMDTTSGGSLGSGAALMANHLYLMPDSRGITTADGATLLARGAYTVV